MDHLTASVDDVCIYVSATPPGGQANGALLAKSQSQTCSEQRKVYFLLFIISLRQHQLRLAVILFFYSAKKKKNVLSFNPIEA